ncbi:MAG: glycosyltransferase family 2 protein [Lysobacteraceae bacterium]
MDRKTAMGETLAVVAPAYNEAEGLAAFHARLAAVLDGLDLACRVIYVDDGSRDATWQVMRDLAAADPRVVALRLSRNFGKELALTAGLDAADADAVMVIDADLQDPPELIPEFVARWRDGFDVVYGTRLAREGETWLKRATAAMFYRLMGRLSATPIPRDTGDFRLMSRRAVSALRGLRERHRFMKGLFAWVGFRQTALPYRRAPRQVGHSKFNYWRLWNFALEGITSFSTVPLRLATYVGLITATLAFSYGVWIMAKTLLWGDPVAGYPSLMSVMLFLGGMQLVALGIIGEYLGRLYDEVKQRPLYLIEDRAGGGLEWAAGLSSAAGRSPGVGDAHGQPVAGRQG